jgi:hypothetical protein
MVAPSALNWSGFNDLVGGFGGERNGEEHEKDLGVSHRSFLTSATTFASATCAFLYSATT